MRTDYGQANGVAGDGNGAAAGNRLPSGPVRRSLYRFGKWLMTRCGARAAPPDASRGTLAKASGEAQRRMLRKIAKRLGVHRGK
jgi:hypothetical protein